MKMAKNKIEDTFTYKFSKKKFDKGALFIPDNLMYEVIAGSQAYGVQNEDSDYDIVGVFMDRHVDLFPQNYGFVLGFDTVTSNRFEQTEYKGEKNRIIHKDREVEGEWRSLTKFFNLAASGSPNLLEILFVRKQCVKYIHPAFGPIRDNAHKFISMKSFHAFKGYMYSQFHRMSNRVEKGVSDNPKRQWMFDEFGYDVKMAYHILRLMDLLDQMLEGGQQVQLDLMRNKEECKRMRAGQLYSWEDFQAKTQERFDFLDSKVREGKIDLPKEPRYDELRNILNSSIEEWYGTDTGQVVREREYVSVDELVEQLNRIEKGVEFLKTPNGFGLGAG